jgi:hypothetical protein
MRYPAMRLYAAALAAVLFGAVQARAEFAEWSYNWTPSATKIFADTPSMGEISLTNEPGGSATGDTFVVATNIKTISTSDPKNPAIFTGAAYSLVLTVFDEASKKSDSMVFAGKFNGVLSTKSAIIMNEFTSPTTQSVVIGNHKYTVTVGPFAPPGPPTASNSGSISALATVTVSEVPEPSTLALASMCVAGAGWWYRRNRGGKNVALNLA